jgi:anti-anti-sigma regulatory factor/anti-sigma regulatory factor (Ser/Thr protein kinase)
MLTCTLDTSSPVAVVTLSGRLTVTTTVEARVAFHKALAVHPAAVIVDLDGVVVADDIALTVLSTFARAASEWPGCPVVISGPTRDVVRDLDRMGISRATPVYADRGRALNALQELRAPRRFRSMITAVPTATALARDVVRRACSGTGLIELTDDAELIVTEMVGNVVRHVGGTMELAVIVRDRFLHLSVRDESPVRPRRGMPDPETGEGGRGLLLVEAVAAGWGTSEVPGGKVVWATLRIPRRG